MSVRDPDEFNDCVRCGTSVHMDEGGHTMAGDTICGECLIDLDDIESSVSVKYKDKINKLKQIMEKARVLGDEKALEYLEYVMNHVREEMGGVYEAAIYEILYWNYGESDWITHDEVSIPSKITPKELAIDILSWLNDGAQIMVTVILHGYEDNKYIDITYDNYIINVDIR